MKKTWVGLVFVLGCGDSAAPVDAGNDASIVDASNEVATYDASDASSKPDASDASNDGDAAAHSAVGLLVPLYTYPTDGTWSALVTAEDAHPTVDIVAVINPNSGPGTSKSTDYATGITTLETAGIVVVGYVPTGYGTKPYSALATVEAAIDAYVSFYPNIQGIFFDEMSDLAGEQSYYQSIATYVTSKGLKLTIGNPGANVPTALVGIFTNLVIYEAQNMPAVSKLNAYKATYGTAGFSYIAYGVSALPDSQTLQTLDAYVRYIYITDLGGGDPYNALPSYLTAEIAALQ